jgi:hypothetical protein
MMPTVPERMILNDELSGDRRAETQREWRCTIQFFIRERAYRGGRLTAVPAQEFKRGGFGHLGIFLGMFSVQLGDNFPRDIRNRLAAGYTLATWCTMTPSERRSDPDTGILQSTSDSPSAKAANPAAPSSMRSANNSARRPAEPLIL